MLTLKFKYGHQLRQSLYFVYKFSVYLRIVCENIKIVSTAGPIYRKNEETPEKLLKKTKQGMFDA